MSPFAASVHQKRVDAIQAEARKDAAKLRLFRAPPEPEAPLARTQELMSLRLAEELEYARRLLEVTGDALIDDPIILHRHGVALQNFDLLRQLLGHVAQVIGSENKTAAVERIGMQELRNRLQRAPLRLD